LACPVTIASSPVTSRLFWKKAMRKLAPSSPVAERLANSLYVPARLTVSVLFTLLGVTPES